MQLLLFFNSSCFFEAFIHLSSLNHGQLMVQVNHEAQRNEARSVCQSVYVDVTSYLSCT